MPFLRKIEDDDAVFYDSIDSTKPIVDQVSIEQLNQFYSEHLKDNSKILDLMAGPDSYLPESLKNIDATGLSIKEQDLQSNSALSQYTVHDLNKRPELPFEDQ